MMPLYHISLLFLTIAGEGNPDQVQGSRKELGKLAFRNTGLLFVRAFHWMGSREVLGEIIRGGGEGNYGKVSNGDGEHTITYSFVE